MKPETVKKKLFQAKTTRSALVQKVIESSTNNFIDSTAAEVALTREELLRYVKCWHEPEISMSIRCAMRCHDVLQQVMSELTRLGFEAEYKLFFTNDCIYDELQGTFYIRIHDKDKVFVGLYKGHAIPKLPDVLSAYAEPANLEHNGAADIWYEHKDGTDEKPIYATLRLLSVWIRKLQKIDAEILSAVKTFTT